MMKQELISITADDWLEFGQSYGHIRLTFSEGVYVLKHERRVLPFLGENEELAHYEVEVLPTNDPFESAVMPEELRTKLVQKK